MYGKVFESMYTGSMYGAGMHVFAVWGWILAHKDENGRVEANPELVAHELGGVAQQVTDALTYLCAPDPNSRSKEQDGCRLVKVSQFGYEVVNNDKYRGGEAQGPNTGGSGERRNKPNRSKAQLLRNVARNTRQRQRQRQ